MKTMMIMMTIMMVMRKMIKVKDDDTDNIKSVNNAYDLNDMIFNSFANQRCPPKHSGDQHARLVSRGTSDGSQ